MTHSAPVLPRALILASNSCRKTLPRDEERLIAVFAAAESSLLSPRVLYWLGKPLLLSQCNHSQWSCLLLFFFFHLHLTQALHMPLSPASLQPSLFLSPYLSVFPFLSFTHSCLFFLHSYFSFLCSLFVSLIYNSKKLVSARSNYCQGGKLQIETDSAGNRDNVTIANVSIIAYQSLK